MSYDPSLASDRDWVRFLVRDNNPLREMLTDAEIDGVLAEVTVSYGITNAARKYLAAAKCLETLHTAWMSRGRGVSSRKVDDLSVVYGTGAGINVDAAMQLKISALKVEAARLAGPAPTVFRVGKSRENRP